MYFCWLENTVFAFYVGRIVTVVSFLFSFEMNGFVSVRIIVMFPVHYCALNVGGFYSKSHGSRLGSGLGFSLFVSRKSFL